jgi:hypothetical protein
MGFSQPAAPPDSSPPSSLKAAAYEIIQPGRGTAQVKYELFSPAAVGPGRRPLALAGNGWNLANYMITVLRDGQVETTGGRHEREQGGQRQAGQGDRDAGR